HTWQAASVSVAISRSFVAGSSNRRSTALTSISGIALASLVGPPIVSFVLHRVQDHLAQRKLSRPHVPSREPVGQKARLLPSSLINRRGYRETREVRPMFDKIVLAVDGSEHSDRAVEAAAELASDGTTEVLVLHFQELGAAGRAGPIPLEQP